MFMEYLDFNHCSVTGITNYNASITAMFIFYVCPLSFLEVSRYNCTLNLQKIDKPEFFSFLRMSNWIEAYVNSILYRIDIVLSLIIWTRGIRCFHTYRFNEYFIALSVAVVLYNDSFYFLGLILVLCCHNLIDSLLLCHKFC